MLVYCARQRSVLRDLAEDITIEDMLMALGHTRIYAVSTVSDYTACNNNYHKCGVRSAMGRLSLVSTKSLCNCPVLLCPPVL